MKVYQAGEAQTADEIIVEFDFMWSGQQVGNTAHARNSAGSSINTELRLPLAHLRS